MGKKVAEGKWFGWARFFCAVASLALIGITAGLLHAQDIFPLEPPHWAGPPKVSKTTGGVLKPTFTFDGELTFRGRYYHNQDLEAGSGDRDWAEDTSYIYTLRRLGTKISVGSKLYAYIQVQQYDSWGEERNGISYGVMSPSRNYPGYYYYPISSNYQADVAKRCPYCYGSYAGPPDWAREAADRELIDTNIHFRRAYVDYYVDMPYVPFHIRVGRQRITLGWSYSIETDKFGADAIRLYNATNKYLWELVYVKDFEGDVDLADDTDWFHGAIAYHFVNKPWWSHWMGVGLVRALASSKGGPDKAFYLPAPKGSRVPVGTPGRYDVRAWFAGFLTFGKFQIPQWFIFPAGTLSYKTLSAAEWGHLNACESDWKDIKYKTAFDSMVYFNYDVGKYYIYGGFLWGQGDKDNKDDHFNAIYSPLADFDYNPVANPMLWLDKIGDPAWGGQRDVVGSNIWNLTLGFGVRPMKNLVLDLQGWKFYADTNGMNGYYGESRSIGWEIDTFGEYSIMKNFTFRASLGYFQPEGYLDNKLTPEHERQDPCLGLEWQLKFLF